jgi:Mrp family chromosome partitioning ATPase
VKNLELIVVKPSETNEEIYLKLLKQFEKLGIEVVESGDED